jgi:hypothetical protein
MGNPSLSAMFLLILLFSVSGCSKQNQYTVIERTNLREGYEIPIVLLHDGHKYYARCNDLKAASDDAHKEVHCGLRVGQTVECEFHPDRDSGYDLICGRKRNANGKLDTYGENELLIVDKETSQ